MSVEDLGRFAQSSSAVDTALNRLANPTATGPSAPYDPDTLSPAEASTNRAVIQDIRDDYADRGKATTFLGKEISKMSDAELWKQFEEDKTYANFNTPLMARETYRAVTGNPTSNARSARLTKLWDKQPSFWSEGGRGWGALGDIIPAMAADPLTYFGGPAAAQAGKQVLSAGMKKAAAKIAELSANGTLTPALKEKLIGEASKGVVMAGIKSGAIVEAQANAVAAAIQSGLTQATNVNLGIQPEFDKSDFAIEVGAGALFGSAVGGAVGGVVAKVAANGLPAEIAAAQAAKGTPPRFPITDVASVIDNEAVDITQKQIAADQLAGIENGATPPPPPAPMGPPAPDVFKEIARLAPTLADPKLAQSAQERLTLAANYEKLKTTWQNQLDAALVSGDRKTIVEMSEALRELEQDRDILNTATSPEDAARKMLGLTSVTPSPAAAAVGAGATASPSPVVGGATATPGAAGAAAAPGASSTGAPASVVTSPPGVTPAAPGAVVPPVASVTPASAAPAEAPAAPLKPAEVAVRDADAKAMADALKEAKTPADYLNILSVKHEINAEDVEAVFGEIKSEDGFVDADARIDAITEIIGNVYRRAQAAGAQEVNPAIIETLIRRLPGMSKEEVDQNLIIARMLMDDSDVSNMADFIPLSEEFKNAKPPKVLTNEFQVIGPDETPPPNAQIEIRDGVAYARLRPPPVDVPVSEGKTADAGQTSSTRTEARKDNRANSKKQDIDDSKLFYAEDDPKGVYKAGDPLSDNDLVRLVANNIEGTQSLERVAARKDFEGFRKKQRNDIIKYGNKALETWALDPEDLWKVASVIRPIMSGDQGYAKGGLLNFLRLKARQLKMPEFVGAIETIRADRGKDGEIGIGTAAMQSPDKVIVGPGVKRRDEYMTELGALYEKRDAYMADSKAAAIEPDAGVLRPINDEIDRLQTELKGAWMKGNPPRGTRIQKFLRGSPDVPTVSVSKGAAKFAARELRQKHIQIEFANVLSTPRFAKRAAFKIGDETQMAAATPALNRLMALRSKTTGGTSYGWKDGRLVSTREGPLDHADFLNADNPGVATDLATGAAKPVGQISGTDVSKLDVNAEIAKLQARWDEVDALNTNSRGKDDAAFAERKGYREEKKRLVKRIEELEAVRGTVDAAPSQRVAGTENAVDILAKPLPEDQPGGAGVMSLADEQATIGKLLDEVLSGKITQAQFDRYMGDIASYSRQTPKTVAAKPTAPVVAAKPEAVLKKTAVPDADMLARTERVLDALKIKHSGMRSANDLWSAVDTMENMKAFPETRQDIADFSAFMSDLYKTLEAYPRQRSVDTSNRVVKAIKTILDGHDPAELAQVLQFFRKIGSINGPVMELGETKPGVRGSTKQGTNKITIGKQIEPMFTGKTMIHEFSHWAYSNILNAEQKGVFWKVIGDTMYDPKTGVFDPNSIGKLLSHDPKIVRQYTPQEMFARLFERYIEEMQHGDEAKLFNPLADPTFSAKVQKMFKEVMEIITAFSKRVLGMQEDAPIPAELRSLFDTIYPNKTIFSNLIVDAPMAVKKAGKDQGLANLLIRAYDFEQAHDQLADVVDRALLGADFRLDSSAVGMENIEFDAILDRAKGVVKGEGFDERETGTSGTPSFTTRDKFYDKITYAETMLARLAGLRQEAAATFINAAETGEGLTPVRLKATTFVKPEPAEQVAAAKTKATRAEIRAATKAAKKSTKSDARERSLRYGETVAENKYGTAPETVAAKTAGELSLEQLTAEVQAIAKKSAYDDHSWGKKNGNPVGWPDEMVAESLRIANNSLNRAVRKELADPWIARVKELSTIYYYRKAAGKLAGDVSNMADELTPEGRSPMAAGVVDNFLSRIRHRDPEIERKQKSIISRFLNDINLTTRQQLSNADVMTVKELNERLGRAPVDGVVGEFYVEYDANKSMKKLSVAISEKSPNSAKVIIHEVGHLVMRLPIFTPEDRRFIFDAYQRDLEIGTSNAVKFVDQGYQTPNPAMKAEEWFADRYADYMLDLYDDEIGTNGIAARRAGLEEMFSKMNSGYASLMRDVLEDDVALQKLFYKTTVAAAEQDVKGSAYTGYHNHLGSTPAEVAAMVANDHFKTLPAAAQQYIFNWTGGNPKIFYARQSDGWDMRRGLIPYSESPFGKLVVAYENPLATRANDFDMINTDAVAPDQKQGVDFLLNRQSDIRDQIRITRSRIEDLKERQTNWSKKRPAPAGEAIEKSTDAEIGGLERKLNELMETDVSVTKTLRDGYGLASNGQVAPMYIKATSVFDARDSASHSPAALLGYVNKWLAIARGWPALEYPVQGGRNGGRDGFEFIGNLIHDAHDANVPGNEITSDELRHLAREVLSENGFDSISFTDDSSGVPSAAYALLRPSAIHVYDESNVRLGREMAEQPKTNTPLNSVVSFSLMDDIDIDADVSNMIDDLMGQASGSPAVGFAFGAALNPKRLMASEGVEKFVEGANLLRFFETGTSALRRRGIHSLADKYGTGKFSDATDQTGLLEAHAVEMARVLRPIEDAMRKLPDAGTGIQRWGRAMKWWGDVAQPASHERIVQALRLAQAGADASVIRNVWKDVPAETVKAERDVEAAIRKSFQDELRSHQKIKSIIGNSGPNYVPQVWDVALIQKDQAKFVDLLGTYFIRDRGVYNDAAGMAKARDDAHRVVNSMLDDNPVWIEPNAKGRNSPADHIDYQRMINLIPSDFKAGGMGDYLSKDLQGTLARYFDNSVRRRQSFQTFGHNNHWISDYQVVLAEGRKGIARLLGSDKVLRRNINATYDGTDTGSVEASRILSYGFSDNEANSMADQALAIWKDTKDFGKVKDYLLSKKTNDAGMPASGHAYERRVDAVASALKDFGDSKLFDVNSAKARPSVDDIDYMEDFSKVVHGKVLETRSSDRKLRTVSKVLRNVNNVTLLSFVTATSLGDVVLPLIRSGSFKAWAKGLKAYASDPDYMEAIRNTGVAMENAIFARLVGMHGSDASRASTAFFNANLLTPWTSTMREIAGAVAMESFKAEMNVLGDLSRKGSRKWAHANRYLGHFGLAELAQSGKTWDGLMADEATNLKLSMAVNRFAQESIFAPNAAERQPWMQTWWGSSIMQFKNFTLQMGRLSAYTMSEFRHGNPMPFFYLVGATGAAGTGVNQLKDIVQSRGGDDDRSSETRDRAMSKLLKDKWGWDVAIDGPADAFLGNMFQGYLMAGGLGLLGNMFYDTAEQMDNGAYGAQRAAGVILGPTASMAFDGFHVAVGAWDKALGQNDTNGKERQAVRILAGRIPGLGGVAGLKESIVDGLAGEGEAKGGGGKGFSGMAGLKGMGGL